eukprot:CAMPEP_0203843876 /NCGR_PEP_ID=MMETSP0359-20131031/2852_1 /ASSEMBLY_ACC=CAM_ASM_000338 /TAXON_ID=268821 /ORGANISM="Scrippsiella Hangoei, Strain SHTV-5" /LENGTH=50 /DNA_ID=CAMNT_0050758711 /DNA_START=77 /DNA_END=226 /DNA_ORIENTATION=+
MAVAQLAPHAPRSVAPQLGHSHPHTLRPRTPARSAPSTGGSSATQAGTPG